MDSHGHNGWVVVWGTNLRNGGLEKIWETSSQSTGTFISNTEDLALGSVLLINAFLDLSDDGGVGSTAKTFIGGNWNENDCWFIGLSWHFSLHELIAFEDHINSVASEISTRLESHKISLHLRSGNHLHCLGNFTDRTYRLHSNLELFLTDGEVSLGNWHNSGLSASLE